MLDAAVQRAVKELAAREVVAKEDRLRNPVAEMKEDLQLQEKENQEKMLNQTAQKAACSASSALVKKDQTTEEQSAPLKLHSAFKKKKKAADLH